MIATTARSLNALAKEAPVQDDTTRPFDFGAILDRAKLPPPNRRGNRITNLSDANAVLHVIKPRELDELKRRARVALRG